MKKPITLSRATDTLQSALVLGSGCSEPDADGGAKDGLVMELMFRGHWVTVEPRKQKDSTALTASQRVMGAGGPAFPQPSPLS